MALPQKTLQRRLYPRLLAGTPAWWAQQAGLKRSVEELREHGIKRMGFRSMDAYLEFVRAPKGSMQQYYQALARARGQTVRQLMQDIRRAQLKRRIGLPR